MDTNQYLDEIARAYNLGSDYAIAKKIGIAKQNVYNYRAGRTHFSDEIAEKVAELLNIPAGKVMADMQAERAPTAHFKKLWHDIAATIKHAAAVVILSLVALLAPVQDVDAKGVNSSEPRSIVIMLNGLCVLIWLFEAITTLLNINLVNPDKRQPMLLNILQLFLPFIALT